MIAKLWLMLAKVSSFGPDPRLSLIFSNSTWSGARTVAFDVPEFEFVL